MTRVLKYVETHRAGDARASVLATPHGEIQTPAFMPVGTKGTVKGLFTELSDVGVEIVLCNAYHLWVRPGHHRIGSWDSSVHGLRVNLTDSAVTSLFLERLTKVTENGVRCLPLDGQYRTLTPEVSIEIQETLGVDMAMAFDECIEWPADRERVVRSTQRTTRWLKRCMDARKKSDKTALRDCSGGFYEDLRLNMPRRLWSSISMRMRGWSECRGTS